MGLSVARLAAVGGALGLRRTTRLPGPAAPGAVAAAVARASVELGGAPVLVDADLEVRHGEVVALVGPNGAGKSTLLSVLSGDRRADRGRVVVDGRPVDEWSTVELAMRRAVLTQSVSMSFPFTVRQTVEMGRAPWVGQEAEDDDERLVAAAMAVTDVVHLANRVFTSLSGGERARAALARVLAQDTGLLLLDEPTAALDIRHQEEVLRLARGQAAAGRAVVVVMHDLGLAAAHADRVVVLSEGRVQASGPPDEVLTDELLGRVYEHPIEVLRHPRTGELLVLPRRDTAGPT
jgi:iron complex transport system ATP-binding protein